MCICPHDSQATKCTRHRSLGIEPRGPFGETRSVDGHQTRHDIVRIGATIAWHQFGIHIQIDLISRPHDVAPIDERIARGEFESLGQVIAHRETQFRNHAKFVTFVTSNVANHKIVRISRNTIRTRVYEALGQQSTRQGCAVVDARFAVDVDPLPRVANRNF